VAHHLPSFLSPVPPPFPILFRRRFPACSDSLRVPIACANPSEGRRGEANWERARAVPRVVTGGRAWRSRSRRGRACSGTARTSRTASRRDSRACSRRRHTSRGRRRRTSGCPSTSTSPSSPSAAPAAAAAPTGRTSPSPQQRSPRSSTSAGGSARPAPSSAPPSAGPCSTPSGACPSRSGTARSGGESSLRLLRRPSPPAASVAEGLSVERAAVDRCPLEAAAAAAAAATGSAAASSVSGHIGGDDLDEEDEGFGCEIGTFGNFKKAKGTVNMSATYNTRNHDIESSVVARGDLWRIEASRGGSTSGNDTSPLYLIQLGPLLFVRDSTLLLPVHLSKQHLLWYGYDRKNGVHSLCPAIWSKHRRWLMMSMMCLNPIACSFMDLQFPNGQLTYVAGEGISASGFLPLFGGLLQAHGKYPGDTRVSFSCKNKRGTRFTPMFQWPDKSVSLGVTQPLAWKRSGLMVRPSVQVSLCPTFGGSDPGVRAEVVHSLKEELNLMCGLSCSRHPSAFTALSIGRSKWNGQVGSSGVVITLETPLNNIGRPSLSVQLNGGFEL
ncbi:unnamed protein product, partial [Urochloa humidicola]